MKSLWFDILNIVFPLYCPICGMPLYNRKEIICLNCEVKLPLTGFAKETGNQVEQLFWGRVPLLGATALFRFEKGSRYQSLLHLLKYKGRKDIGFFLGKLLGQELKDTIYSSADVIIPVPLHPAKERKRGYNQSEIIAEGISHIMEIPINTTMLSRCINTASQTRKNRIERWENMKDVFHLHTIPEAGLRVLLVDDVITTGATMEACALILTEDAGTEVFAVSLAYA